MRKIKDNTDNNSFFKAFKIVPDVQGLVAITLAIILMFAVFCGAFDRDKGEDDVKTTEVQTTVVAEVSSLPAETTEIPKVDASTVIPVYSGNSYAVINDNKPTFKKSELVVSDLESYSNLDELGRCGVAIACLGIETAPKEERGDISSVRPSGWTSGNEVGQWNRCHLIGFQLAGENANKRNLITGTRYLNIEGMLPFENMVDDYIEETNNHVLYRVTPIFTGDNLVADGVQLEGYSIEDDGEGICFNVYCYNVQPGVEINYLTGESWMANSGNTNVASFNSDEKEETFIANNSSMTFHKPSCEYAKRISESNKEEVCCPRSDLVDAGFTPCKNCNP